MIYNYLCLYAQNISKEDRKIITLNISAPVRMQILIFLC